MKLFQASVLDQVVLSAANFLIGFILIRRTTDNDYGIYVLVLTAQQLAVSIQKSWLTGPLTIVVSRKPMEERVRNVGAIKDAQRRLIKILLGIAWLIPLGGWLGGMLTARMALLLALAVLSIWAALRREYLRDMLLLFSRPQNLLQADVLFAVVLLLGGGFATISREAAVVWALVALVAAALMGEFHAYRMLGRNPGWVSGQDAAPIMKEVRPLGLWSMIGALCYWLYSYASNYILAGVLDLKAVADVNATRLLLMPVIMLTVGVQGLLIPMATLWYPEVGMSRVIKRLLLFMAGMLAVDLAYLAVVWVSREWLVGSLLHKQIDQRDLLLLLWAGVAMAGVVRDVMGCALFAAGKLKSLAGQGILAAAVSLAITWFGIQWWGAATGLIAQIVGEVINLIGIFMLLYKARQMAAPSPAAPTVAS